MYLIHKTEEKPITLIETFTTGYSCFILPERCWIACITANRRTSWSRQPFPSKVVVPLTFRRISFGSTGTSPHHMPAITRFLNSKLDYIFFSSRKISFFVHISPVLSIQNSITVKKIRLLKQYASTLDCFNSKLDIFFL